MEQNYIKVTNIYKKLRESEKNHRIIYISGAVGFGKTSAVEYYYRKKPHLVLSGSAGFLPEIPLESEILHDTIVIDDISWVTDLVSREYIRNLILHSKKLIILIGRSTVPSWLRGMAVEQKFILANEKDLVLSEKEAESLLESRDLHFPREQFQKLLKDTGGHPLSMIFVLNHLEGGQVYNDTVIQAAKLDLFHYYDTAFYEKWDKEMRQVLLALCQFPTFTVELAETVTGNNRVPILFERAMSVGTFLTKLDECNYSYRHALRLYFQWKQNIIYTQKEKKEILERAALYYELHNQIEEALNCYQKSGSEDKIAKLLEKNALKHPGTAHFFETREYYFSLPEDTVKQSPILMSGLSMLYSMTLQKQKSEEWLKELMEFEKHAKSGSEEQKEAKIRIAYLNIALPHNGIHGMIKIMKNIAIMMTSKKVKLPEFSVTSNLPSIMNGGLDFCEWSRNDKELAVLMKYPIELVLGDYGVGLVNIALAESGFEKGTLSGYEIMTRLNTGYMMADTSGKIEMCFVANGLLVREHIANGQIEIGEQLLNAFSQKVQREQAQQLLPNITTFHMWIELLKGNQLEMKQWLETAPDENIEFCILDRYHYINKVRVYIAMDEKAKAISLMERLKVYFTLYERHYLWMECQILKAILFYRMGDELWEQTLREVLCVAKRYHFVRIFADEGAALKPLLDKLTEVEVKDEYLSCIQFETNQMATWYPEYLKSISVLEETLTNAEKRIIKLLCTGASRTEICEICVCTMNTYKFHIRNIYRKLHVNNRADAEREAIRLGLNQ